MQCPPDVSKNANDDDDEYGGVVLGCYDEALGSPWSCGDAGGASVELSYSELLERNGATGGL